MSRFRAIKTISLKDIGEGWTDKCYIRFYSYSLEDFKKISNLLKDIPVGDTNPVNNIEAAEEVIKLHTALFVDGKGLDNETKKVIDIEAEDVADIMCLPSMTQKIQETLVKGNSRLKE